MKKFVIWIGVLIGLSVVAIAYWMNNEQPYCTQHIYYRLISNPSVTIELQMQDIGARGYNRRIVKVTPCRVYDSVVLIDTNTIDKKLWKKVDEEVNELGLKSP
jgi:hypothetical protein